MPHRESGHEHVSLALQRVASLLLLHRQWQLTVQCSLTACTRCQSLASKKTWCLCCIMCMKHCSPQYPRVYASASAYIITVPDILQPTMFATSVAAEMQAASQCSHKKFCSQHCTSQWLILLPVPQGTLLTAEHLCESMQVAKVYYLISVCITTTHRSCLGTCSSYLAEVCRLYSTAHARACSPCASMQAPRSEAPRSDAAGCRSIRTLIARGCNTCRLHPSNRGCTHMPPV